jgi:DNA-binding transcriptional ArsR family regulator
VKTAGTFEIESLDESKTILMDHVANVPGIRYRELLKVSGFSNGVLFYHLTGLEEADLIRVERKRAKKTTRYYTGKAISTVSSHLGQLKQEKLISIRRSEQGFHYSLTNPELVADVALKYKLRLIDKSVNNFIDMVEEL